MLLTALLVTLLSDAALAEVPLDPAPAQGALVVGLAAPDDAVSLDGRMVRVAADGRFVLGFGRDATAAVLSVRHADGTVESKTLAVAKRDWPVQRIDGLPADSVTPPAAVLARIKGEAALVAAARARDTADPWFLSGFVRPAEGPVSGVFGSQRILNGEARAPHSGADIAAPAGAPVVAAAAGVVTLARPDLYFTGGTILLDHGFGLSTIYAHLSDIVVAEGAPVAQGQLIGHVGATGRATGPHLHWGVSWFDVKLDPDAALAALPGVR